MIGVNVYVFIQQIAASNPEAFITTYAFVPSLVNLSDFSTFAPFLTSLFLHGSFFHLFANMMFLWVFGDNIESFYGKAKYLIIYFLSGFAGSFVQYMLNPTSSIPMLGASGAVSGILGAYFVSHPHSKIRTLFPILFYFTIIEIPAVVYLFYWFALQVFSGIAGFSSIQADVGGVAFFAHIGGFVTGVIFAKIFGSKDKRGIIEAEIVG